MWVHVTFRSCERALATVTTPGLDNEEISNTLLSMSAAGWVIVYLVKTSNITQ